jgi:tetratricopeptide (TPR) repeat protein
VRAREHALAAIRSFRRLADRRGEGYACYVLGTWSMMQGDLRQAGRWWDRAHRLGTAGPPGSEIAMAHRGLTAYAEGRLAAATALAEEAVALARLRGLPRREGTALVNVAVFRLWSGQFAAALAALDTAEDAFAEVPDPFDRYELPLGLAVRGVVWALRGQPARAETDFAAGVTAARTVREPLYEAIVRTLRAEFTAPADPRRARQDASWALAEFDRRGERWWRTWALQAGGVAALEAGMYTAAEVALREVLALPQGPLESARSRLLLGEALLRAGRTADAAAPLDAAADAFAALGAQYWSIRARIRLGDVRPDQAAAWREQASRAGTTEPATLDLTGVPFDLPELWTAARRPEPDGAVRLAERLRRPILTRWAYDDWVLALRRHNERLADELSSLERVVGAGRPPAA